MRHYENRTKGKRVRLLYFFNIIFFFYIVFYANVKDRKDMIKSLCMFSPGVQCSCSGLSSLHPALCVCGGGGLLPACGRSGRLWIYSGSCAWRKCRSPEAGYQWTSFWIPNLIKGEILLTAHGVKCIESPGQKSHRLCCHHLYRGNKPIPLSSGNFTMSFSLKAEIVVLLKSSSEVATSTVFFSPLKPTTWIW